MPTIKELLRELLPHALWELLKCLLGPTVLGATVWFSQKIRGIPPDWGVMGVVFVVSLVLFVYATERGHRFHTEGYGGRSGQVAQGGRWWVVILLVVGVGGFVLRGVLQTGGRELVSRDVPPEQKSVSLEQPPQIEPALPEGSDFNDAQRTRLHELFLSIPRPCIFRITSPPEHADLRQILMGLISKAEVTSVAGWGHGGAQALAACETRDEERDSNPALSPDQLGSTPSKIIMVNIEDPVLAWFVASQLENAVGLRTQTGHWLPPERPEHLIYIQIGTGPLRK